MDSCDTILTDQIGADLCLVVVGGEQDLSTLRHLEEELDRAEIAATDIVIDLSGATFIDSSIAGLLIERSMHPDTDTDVAIVLPAGGFPARVMEVLGIEGRLPAYESRADALRALGR
jgi:hypothetical protein